MGFNSMFQHSNIPLAHRHEIYLQLVKRVRDV
jgi:hypothetical protein